jgi:beta-lactamase regulating signal transducer with metallopeptidase domain
MNILLTNFLRLQSQYPHLAALCLGVIKSSFVIALTFCAAVFLRRQSALARNWVWRCAIIGLLGLTYWQFGPVRLTRIHPVWQVSPAPDVSIAYPQALHDEPSGDVVKTAPPESMRLQTPQRSAPTNGFWDISENNVQRIWCAGIAIFLIWRGIRGVAGYYWLKKSASPPGVSLLEAGRRISKLADLATPPRLAVCNSLPTPLLTGWIKPSIFLPADYVQWKREKLDAVLLHEVAHWQRMDGIWQTLAAFTRSIWWWNPLAWYAVAQLKAEAEHAADEMVVLRQHDAPNYAQVLVEIAAAAGRQDFSAGIAMVGSSSLERRIRAILRDNPWRGKLGALGVGAAIALTCVFLVLGAFYLGAAKASAQPNAPEAKDISSNSLTREILVAADAGDQKKVSALLDGGDELGIYTALQAIQLALNTRELRAFTTLDDLFARSAFGKNWKLDDATLRSLVKDGRTDFLDALLARGLDLSRLSAQSGVADKATAAWMTGRIAEVARQRADIEALCKAANTGDLPAIRRLLAAGVDVNCVGKDHNTPLIRAVFKNQLQAAQLLLDHGAQVDKPRYPGWDYTPLCLVNSVPMAELLKKNGANVHARLYGGHSSILTYVAMFAKPDVVAWFLKQGLDPKEVDDDGESLLFELRDADVAKLLLEAGVDPNRTN